jgi:hypothetical protein
MACRGMTPPVGQTLTIESLRQCFVELVCEPPDHTAFRGLPGRCPTGTRTTRSCSRSSRTTRQSVQWPSRPRNRERLITMRFDSPHESRTRYAQPSPLDAGGNAGRLDMYRDLHELHRAGRCGTGHRRRGRRPPSTARCCSAPCFLIAPASRSPRSAGAVAATQAVALPRVAAHERPPRKDGRQDDGFRKSTAPNSSSAELSCRKAESKGSNWPSTCCLPSAARPRSTDEIALLKSLI